MLSRVSRGALVGARRALATGLTRGPVCGAAVATRRAFARSVKAEPEPLSLPAALAIEIQEEAANDGVDQEYADARADILKRFKLHEELGSSLVKLTKSTGGEAMEVSFNVQDEEEAYPGDLEEDGEEGEDMDAGAGINFDVKLSKDAGAMLFKCTATAQGELQINHLQYLPKGKAADDMNLYDGPQFDQLSDTLQEAVRLFLEDRGVDGDLCFFVLAHSPNKEQKEYVNWLNKLMEFSDSK